MNPYNRRSYSGTASDTSLATGVDNAALTITVTDATGWPDGTGGPFEVTFEPDTSSEEKCWASGRTGNTITLLARGMEGAAVAHAASTTVRHGLSALDVNEANYAVSQTVGQVTAKGSILVGSAANTLTEVTKGSAGQAPVWQADGSVAAANPTPAAHTHAEADVTDLTTDLGNKLTKPATAFAKGSLLVGTGAGTYDTKAVGSDGTVPTADSTAADGVSWKTPQSALLAVVSYNPASRTIINTASNTNSAFVVQNVDTTNLKATITAPSSGNVLVHLVGSANIGLDAVWGLTTVASPSAWAGSPVLLPVQGSGGIYAYSVSIYLTGLSGAVTLYWAGAVLVSGTAEILRCGGSVSSPTTYTGPAVMEVWAV